LIFVDIRERHSTVATVRALRKYFDSLAQVERGVPKRRKEAVGNAGYTTAK